MRKSGSFKVLVMALECACFAMVTSTLAALVREDATGCKAECHELIGVAALAWRFAHY